MIAGIGVLLWACLFWGLTYAMWKSIEGYARVYLLIAFSALFLMGVFVLFPYLKGFTVASVQHGLMMFSLYFR